MQRRVVLLGGLVAGLAWLAWPRPGAPSLRTAAALRRHLPPGLDPHAIGATLRAAHPACSPADCQARAALSDLADLAAASTADFARGNTVTVDGWVLSHTEAWLCATLA